MKFLCALLLSVSVLGSPLAVRADDAPAPPEGGQRSAVAALKDSLQKGDAAETQAPAHAADWRDDKQVEGAGAGLKMLEALALCCGVFLIGVHFYKKYTGTGSSFGKERRMRLVERLPVSPKSSLLLVEVDGRKVLISVGGEQVSHIPLTDAGEGEFRVSLDEVCSDDLKASAS